MPLSHFALLYPRTSHSNIIIQSMQPADMQFLGMCACVCVFTTSAPLYSKRHAVERKISSIVLFLFALLFGMER